MHQWWDKSYPYRIPITIKSGKYARVDKTIDIEINLTHVHDQSDRAVNTSLYTFYVVEVDDEGTILPEHIPFQCDLKEGSTSANQVYALTLYLTGITAAGTTRQFYAYLSKQGGVCTASHPARYVKLTDAIMHEDQESYRIETPGATYIYHKLGAGFASLLDPGGLDWIKFHPWGGSDGKYRGIPNLVYPEGYFHPGNTGCHSRILHEGPVKVAILSTSTDGEWMCRWDITPRYATLTVLKAPQPYWFLYEGTPGGALDEEGDYIVRSTGERTPASERWEGVIPEPEWLYFGTRDLDRVLYLIHHEHDDAIDSYWPMEHNMTVFGFGRLNLNKYMVLTPAHFTIGFAEIGNFTSVSTMIDSAFRPIAVEVRQCQSLELLYG